MTGNRFLLDTNIISALLKGETAIADNIDKAAEVCIPIIVIGELYYGALYSTRIDKNIKAIKNLVLKYEIVPLNEETTRIYGSIKAQLRQKGKPLPENDIWIAAITLQNKFILVTRDKHFKEIDNFPIKKW